MASSNSVEFDFHQEEVSLEVPKDLTQFSLGFAIDAGGSVTKLVYRSKKDYTNGKLNEHIDPSVGGILRMRYFRSGDDDALINFIRDNCDIIHSAREEDSWFQTGVQTQRFKKMVEEVGKTKILMMSEMEAAHQGLIGFYSRVPDLRSNWLSVPAVGRALSMNLELMGMLQKANGMGDTTLDFSRDVDPAVVAEHVTKITTIDAETLTKELSAASIQWPCVLAIFGSAAAISIMHEDGKNEFGNFGVVSGKTFLGLGKQLCGAKDFDDLIEMASRGDHTKVNTLSGDMKKRDREEVDWYSVMPDNFIIFSLGKLADDAYAGTYTKDDLAAGLLHSICSVVAKLAVSVARLSKVNCVVISGSLGSRKVARETLQEYALTDTLLQPLSGEDPIKWVFIPHPGFICALGVWYHNWKIENGRRTQ